MDSWINTAFDGEFVAAQPSGKRKRSNARAPVCSRPESRVAASSHPKAAADRRGLSATFKAKRPNDETVWVDRYAPTCQSEVAGNKKKLESLKSWLQTSTSKHGAKSSILLLTGPCGCGKTAAVKALCKENGIEVQEWINPSSLAVQNVDGSYISGDSQLKQFEGFLIRASKYLPLNIFSGSEAPSGRIILLEDLPNALYRDVGEFHNQLSRYRKRGGCPVVIILSAGGIVSQKSLLPDAQISEFQVECLSFNAVPKTDLCRCLQAIADREGISRAHANIRTAIERISSMCDGDIRSAINALQFNYCATDPPVVVDAYRNDEMSGKDLPLNLFRALGKVLYCKRMEKEADKGYNTGDCTSVSLSRASAVPRPLLFDPEEVFVRSRASEDFYVMCLHQNYLDFAKDVSAAARTAECMSLSDCAVGKDWETTCYMRQQTYGVSIATRGYLYANSVGRATGAAPATGWRPLRKPAWYNTNKMIMERSDGICALFAEDAASLSARVLVTEVLPLRVKAGAAATFLNPGQAMLANNLAAFRQKSGLRGTRSSIDDAYETLDDRDDGADIAGSQGAAAVFDGVAVAQPGPGPGCSDCTVPTTAEQVLTDASWEPDGDLSDWELSDCQDGDATSPPAGGLNGSDDDDSCVIEDYED